MRTLEYLMFFQLLHKIKRLLGPNSLRILFWAIALNIAFGVAFYYAERGVQQGLTLTDSLWWSMVTMTTVGYGDFYAQTPIGRYLISYPCMVLGIGIIGYLVGAVANYFIELSNRKRKGAMQIKLQNHIIICNYPEEEKLLKIVEELHAIDQYHKSHILLISNTITEIPERIRAAGIHFLRGHCNDEETLFKANILHCEGVLILPEDPQSIRSDDLTFTTGSLIELISKEHNKDIKTVAELNSARSLRTMTRSGVDGTISADGMASCLLAQEFQHPGVSRVIEQMITSTHGSQIYLYPSRLAGRRIVELQKAVLEHEANIQIIGIIHQGKQILNPDKQVKIAKGDLLIILSEDKQDLDAIEEDLMGM